METEIFAGLLGHFDTISLSEELTIAWPNNKFTPPSAGPDVRWLRVSHVPAETFPLSITHSNRYAGFLQIDVFNGIGGSEVTAIGIADEIAAHFVRGTRITITGAEIKIHRQPSRLPTVQDHPWIMLPVRINYQCLVST